MNETQARLAPVLGYALVASLTVAMLGGLLTDQGAWSRQLTKPSWQPPGWIFGPVWAALFMMIAISLAKAWSSSRKASERQRVAVLFAFNGALNVLWSGLFFHMHRPDLAAVEIVALWASILLLIVALWKISRSASLYLTPYLAWVSFAALINAEIVRLNGPFAG